MKIGSDVARWLFWVVVQTAGFLADNLFDFAKSIAILDITKIKLADQNMFLFWYEVVFQFFLCAVLVRAIILYFRFTKQVELKTTQTTLLKGLVGFLLMIFIMNQLPLIFEAGAKTNHHMINNVYYFSGLKDDVKISTIIVSAGNSIEKDVQSKLSITDKSTTKFITMKEVSINDTGGGVSNWWFVRDFNDYTYFPGTWELLFTMFVMVYVCIIIFTITLDIGKRFFELIALFLFSFIPISAMWYDTEPFHKWVKQLFGIWLSNFATIWLLLVTLITVSWVQVNFNIFFSMIVFVSGLLFSMNGSQTIARLMGIETSGGALAQLAQMSQALNPAVVAASQLGGSMLKPVLGGIGKTANAGGGLLGNLALNRFGISTSSGYSQLLNNPTQRDAILNQRAAGKRDYLYRPGSAAANLRNQLAEKGGVSSRIAQALENRYEKRLAEKSYRNGGIING